MNTQTLNTALRALRGKVTGFWLHDPNDPLKSMRNYIIAGFVVVLFLAGGVGGWAATTRISGALIAPGTVVVELEH